MATSKLTEKTSVETVKSAARFVITQLETVGGSQVESVRRAGMEATVTALKDAGVNDGCATDEDIGHKLFSDRKTRRGYISGAGNWTNVNNNQTKVYSHALVPISASDSVTITAQSGVASYYAFLKNDNAPVNNAAAPLCTGTSLSTVSSGNTATPTVPEDANFMLVMVVRNDVSVAPAAYSINGLNELGSVAQNLSGALTGIANNASGIQTNASNIATHDTTLGTHAAQIAALQGVDTAIKNVMGYYTKTGDLERGSGNISAAKQWANVGSGNYEHVIVPVTPGMTGTIRNGSVGTVHYAYLTSYSTPVTDEAAPLVEDTSTMQVAKDKSATFTIPAGTVYLFVLVKSSGNELGPTLLLNGFNLNEDIVTNVQSMASGIADNAAGIQTNADAISALDTRVTALENDSGVKWCAMGDSITEGVYSVNENGQAVSHTDKTNTWAYRLARAKGWTLTNMGVGGTGFIDPKNGVETGIPADEKRGWWLAHNTDFSQYNLITVAYGVNDYNANWPLGELNDPEDDLTDPSKIYGAIQSTIEGIMLTAKKAKLILITPLNERGYGDSRGDYDSNYALGHPNSGRTLKQVRDAIIECCEYYGIEYIDQSYTSVINRLTLKDGVESMAPDGVHPSLDAHELLARELGAKIHFGPAG